MDTRIYCVLFSDTDGCQNISFIDWIIRHLELSFEAEQPPPRHHQELPMAAEEKGEYF